MIIQARLFATAAHSTQLRKYTNDPYIIHPASVARLVTEAGGDTNQIIAAWLHDTVEDTDVTLDDIRAEFGEDVADLVYWLTDVSRPSDGNRATRKAMDRDHIARAPDRAKAIKLADLIDNSRSITEHDQGFSKVYMAEKAALLGVLRCEDAVSVRLMPVAERILREWRNIS